MLAVPFNSSTVHLCIAALVAGVLGLVLVFFCVLVVIWWRYTKRRRIQNVGTNDHQPSVMSIALELVMAEQLQGQEDAYITICQLPKGTRTRAL